MCWNLGSLLIKGYKKFSLHCVCAMFNVYLNKMKCAISEHLALSSRAFMVQQIGMYLPPRNKPLIPCLKPLSNRPSNDEWPSFGYGVQNFKEQTSEISHGIINHKRTPTPRYPLHKIAAEIEKYN